MKTPFTTEQFFSVFENYNSTVFPAQIIILLAGLFSLLVLFSKRSGKNQAIGGLQAFLWIWMGAVYHIAFFSSINPPAFVFGALFILQGFFFFLETFTRKKLRFQFAKDLTGYLAVFFILFGTFIYPLISYFLAGAFPMTISFGLPCPTTIFTFGFLILARKNLSKYLVIIPTLWALIGTTAALNFGVYQDFMLLLTAIIANLVIFTPRKPQIRKHSEVTSA